MIKNTIGASALLLFATACTQQPARIDLKGQQTYGRSGQAVGSSYSSGYNSSYNASVSEVTEQKASVDSIGISDLSPPPKTNSQPATKLENNTEPKKDIGTQEKTTVNPWTNKPRSENEPQKIETKEKEEIKLAASEELKEAIRAEEKQVEKKTEISKSKSFSSLKWPLASKKILSSFGEKGEGKANDGIYIAANEGDEVWAVADGEVVYVNEMKGYGNMVLIKHSGGKTSSYGNLSKIAVDKYTRVKQGDVVGYVGATESIKKPQLFFSLYKGKQPIDPQKYLSKEG